VRLLVCSARWMDGETGITEFSCHLRVNIFPAGTVRCVGTFVHDLFGSFIQAHFSMAGCAWFRHVSNSLLREGEDE